MTDLLERARESYQRQQWTDAYTRLSAADREIPLEPEDLERLATSACLVGKEEGSAENWVRAHQEYLRRGQVARAVRCLFWLAHGLLNRGEHARGGAWITEARRLLDEAPQDCAERGYLLLPVAIKHLDEGDAASACEVLQQAAEIGERFDDSDLIALARHGWGRALIRNGDSGEGVRMLDAAMVVVEAGNVSPIVAGEVYCSVISGCLEVYDLQRAQEWTSALTHWCASQPDLVPYSNQCLVRRVEVMQLHGAWPEALDTVQRACERCLDGLDQVATGAAFYQQAELHRLSGDFVEAEEAYRQANRWGRNPQPGLALLRLEQGQIDTAAAAIRSQLDETHERRLLSRLLPACVDIMLAAGDIRMARVAADRLLQLAAELAAPFLQAVADRAHGAVLLAEGDPRSSLDFLRRAWEIWQALRAPYEAARVRVLIAVACRELGDEDTAALELDAAHWAFRQLGAGPDVIRVEELARKGETGGTSGLTPREIQVLRLVASGKTNRIIATELFISEKTVARHVSNILGKLGLSTRAAATAFAYQQGLV